MKNITPERQFLINRLGYLRNKAGLSARELSGRMDKSDAYIAKFENGDFSIPAEAILEAIKICNSTPEEFFWEDIANFKQQKQIITAFNKLSNESKEVFLNLLNNLK